MEREELHHLHSQSCDCGFCQHTDELLGGKAAGLKGEQLQAAVLQVPTLACGVYRELHCWKQTADGSAARTDLQITLLNLALAPRQATYGFRAPNQGGIRSVSFSRVYIETVRRAD